ncbi:carbohydrate sulfotransferase 10-like isoform X2 [Acanthaster planci]|uniref:Carbohydrate sulfotransferase n=1 Tax=Acanthaster planci TaxID=133434 RepID=A0A8B7ZWW0_ACAPL|nr:carbohydrate sulfotransferase 10-like isoform X2 [Acanthaster planci]
MARQEEEVLKVAPYLQRLLRHWLAVCLVLLTTCYSSAIPALDSSRKAAVSPYAPSVDPRNDDVSEDLQPDGQNLSQRFPQSVGEMNSGRDGDPDNRFMQEQALVQLRRKKTMRDACRRQPLIKQEERYAARFFILKKSKILYCALPKTGTTNWKRVFMVLEGFRPNVENVSFLDANVNNGFKEVPHSSLLRQILNLNTYTRFVQVRHPFARLISAYRNKISGEATRSGQDPKFTDISLHIVRKYRRGAEGEDFNPETLRVTWDEWIQYLTDPTELSRFDPHWREMYKLCLPCRVNYDVVGKLETVESDSKFLLNYLDLKQLRFPTSRPLFHHGIDREDKELLEHYFGNMSTRNLQRLYNIYKLDFELFGYKTKPVL